jgi:hypothetical protein
MIMERTHKNLEDRYKDKGTAKIRSGEYLLHDLKATQKFNLQQQPWNFLMKLSKKRYMSNSLAPTVETTTW